MERYTWIELSDMHLTYGAANCNGRAAQRLYQQRYPGRRIPHHSIFESIHRHLRENGSFGRSNGQGRRRSVRTLRFEEQVLAEIENNPSTSTRAIAFNIGTSNMNVWNVLREQLLHPFHRQRVQSLTFEDYPRRLEFARWYLQQCETHPEFSSLVLFTDEASFTRTGMFNTHNSHVWSQDNTHATFIRSYQTEFTVNVWAGIINNFLIGPYILPLRLNGNIYCIFLEEVLPELMEDVPLVTRRQMWFQHDGAPAHFSTIVRNYLDQRFNERWIGRGGPIAWPPRSPDLSSLDFFLWGHMKTLIYETPIETEEELVARITAAAYQIQNIPAVFERVRESMFRRCHLCIEANGGIFEHVL